MRSESASPRAPAEHRPEHEEESEPEDGCGGNHQLRAQRGPPAFRGIRAATTGCAAIVAAAELTGGSSSGPRIIAVDEAADELAGSTSFSWTVVEESRLTSDVAWQCKQRTRPPACSRPTGIGA